MRGLKGQARQDEDLDRGLVDQLGEGGIAKQLALEPMSAVCRPGFSSSTPPHHPKALATYQRAGFVVYARRPMSFEDPRRLGILLRSLRRRLLPPLDPV